jgi:hypothetical protein
MIIEYEDYRLELKDGRYDVYKKVLRNKMDKDKKPTGETYEALSILGYGFRLEGALRKVIEDRLENNLGTVTLNKAIVEYQKEYHRLHSELNSKIPS